MPILFDEPTSALDPRMTTEELRDAFLVEKLFEPGSIDLVYVDLDRTVIGSAVPLDEALTLTADPDLRADYFTERRELGILNIGGAGSVTVDEQKFDLSNLDALYVGRGSRDISFVSEDASTPAEFYLLSYPAHSDYPVAKVEPRSIEPTILGSTESANHRRITRLIHLEGARSCQITR